jgi:hypothetical protein
MQENDDAVCIMHGLAGSVTNDLSSKTLLTSLLESELRGVSQSRRSCDCKYLERDFIFDSGCFTPEDDSCKGVVILRSATNQLRRQGVPCFKKLGLFLTAVYFLSFCFVSGTYSAYILSTQRHSYLIRQSCHRQSRSRRSLLPLPQHLVQCSPMRLQIRPACASRIICHRLRTLL